MLTYTMVKQETLRVKNLNMADIPDGSVCAFIGKRKSGKSWAIRDMMYHKRDISIGLVVAGSEKVNPFFANFFPASYIESEYEEKTLDNIKLRQTKIKRMQKRRENDPESRNLDTRFMLVFEDSLHDNKWTKSKQIKNIFMNGRHFGLFFILSMQYVIGIPPNLRTNIDYAFLFRDYSINNRRKLYDNFGGPINSFAMFCTLMDNLDQYECLVICTDANKTQFRDQVMYFKAKKRQFKFGSDALWAQDAKIKTMRKKIGRKSSSSHNSKFRIIRDGDI